MTNTVESTRRDTGRSTANAGVSQKANLLRPRLRALQRVTCVERVPFLVKDSVADIDSGS